MPHIRRVTIFGGSGFVGRHIVQRLARDGIRVLVVGRNALKAKYLIPMGDVGQIVTADIDIRDENSVAAAIHGADAVINLVGILYERGGQRFDALQNQGAARVARLAAAAGVRKLVHISAIGADPNSRSRYARSKAMGEQAVRAAFPGAVILRPSIVFGPEDHFFNDFADLGRRLPALPLIGGGNTRFQPVYVADVAEAVDAALTHEHLEGQTFELGGPQVFSFRELMAFTLKEIGRPVRLISLPWGLARLQATFFSILPKPPLTQDQITLLQSDNVVSPAAKTFADLGLVPTAMDLIVPLYLSRFRPGGWFSTRPGLQKAPT